MIYLRPHRAHCAHLPCLHAIKFISYHTIPYYIIDLMRCDMIRYDKRCHT